MFRCFRAWQLPPSKLDDRVRSLIETICDVKMMESAMTEIGFDAKKMPLGKLSPRIIQQGYEVLKKIETVLNDTSRGARSQLTDLTSQFYTVRLCVCARMCACVLGCVRSSCHPVLCWLCRSSPTTSASPTLRR